MQVAYLSKKLQGARAQLADADEARQKLAQPDRDACAALADLHRDMAIHVVRHVSLKSSSILYSQCLGLPRFKRLHYELDFNLCACTQVIASTRVNVEVGFQSQSLQADLVQL